MRLRLEYDYELESLSIFWPKVKEFIDDLSAT